MTVEIAEMALFERLQRALRKRGMFLRLADSRKQKRWGLGRDYIVGAKGVVNKDIDIHKLARDLKVLEPLQTSGD
jgi:hypothetical protein